MRVLLVSKLAFLFLIAPGKDSLARQASSVFNDFNYSVAYTSDLFANLRGGFDSGIRYFDNLDVSAEFGFGGFDFFFYGLGNQGGNLSELSGDIQTASNIEAQNSWRLYEAWISRSFPVLKSSLLFGLYDLNSEFDVTNTGSLFINSSHGIGPEYATSGELTPSIFPLTSLALRLKTRLYPGMVIKAAVFDAVPSDPADTRGTSVLLRSDEGLLLSSELVIKKPGQDRLVSERGVDQNSPYRLVIGGWKYSRTRTGWNGKPESDQGLYAMIEGVLHTEQNRPDEGLSGFIRYGIANQDINRFSSYVGTGLVYTGVFQNGKKDKLGAALAIPANSDAFVNSQMSGGPDYSQNETNVELTYFFTVTDQVNIQLDAQYILNPNLSPDLDHALVTGLRTMISF